jgi:enterobacterial common antigen flippase
LNGSGSKKGGISMETETAKGGGYKQILKSTFIMGASSLIVTVLGIIRTKFIAMILGPSGVGLTGIYMNISTLVRTFSGMGIGESGMRQIAGACGTGDQQIIARTAQGIRRTSLLSGVAGFCLLLFASSSVSRLTFGGSAQTIDIAILAATVLFGTVSAGQIALIQGTRRIGDLAKVNVFGAVLGTVISVPITYLFGERGVVYILLAVAATAILTSWWYSQKIDIPKLSIGWRDSFREARPLVTLGVALMLGGLVTAGAQYVLRVVVIRYGGLSSAGIYHAATTLSLVYVGVILNAMLTDFYPRLSSAARDLEECKSLINNQAEVGLLLVVPGVLAIMTFAPLVISLFYSPQFMPAVDILRWQMLGGVLQAVTWPMGYMIRAQGSGKLVWWTEFYANVTHLGLAWLGISYFGLVGVGMSFFGKDLCYLLLMYYLLKVKYRFSFTAATFQVLASGLVATAAVFAVLLLLDAAYQLPINAAITMLVAGFSLKVLVCKARSEMAPGFLIRIKARLGF